MLEIDVPGWRRLVLRNLVLDLNGTVALDGTLLPVHGAISILREQLSVQLLSADTHGTLDTAAAELGVTAIRLAPETGQAEQKAAYIRGLGPDSVVAIGNGSNDQGMLLEAALGIAVYGGEGCSTAAAAAADLVVGSVQDALGLLLTPLRLVATLRR